VVDAAELVPKTDADTSIEEHPLTDEAGHDQAPQPYPAPGSGYPPPGPGAQGYPQAYPSGYPPPYGYPPPGYGYGPPPAQSTNGMAIASMVLGIVWIDWIGSVLALIFGYIARGQIRQRPQNGGGMAIAGIVLGWVGIGFLILFIVLFAVADSGSHHIFFNFN
jgi:hypothetical protein